MTKKPVLYDFPDYTHGNPWQLQTIGTSNDDLEIIRQSQWPPPKHVNFLHLGWEDIFLFNASSANHATQLANQVANQITEIAQNGVKIIWTIHNMQSHTSPYIDAERIIRNSLFANSSLIVIMSPKHLYLIPPEFTQKVSIIPHYIIDLKKQFSIKTTNRKPILFRYGAPRNETNLEMYATLLKLISINKIISDPRLEFEIDNSTNILVRRRFSRLEELLYGSISSFSFFSRLPSLNSGVFNFYLGCRNAVLHSNESVIHLDIPPSFFIFNLKRFTSIEEMIDAVSTYNADKDDDLNDFLDSRDPALIRRILLKNIIEYL